MDVNDDKASMIRRKPTWSKALHTNGRDASKTVEIVSDEQEGLEVE